MGSIAGKRVVIVGAGLAGSLLAVSLARQGCSVRVYERRPDPRARGYVGGRSINLALSARGIHALASVGLDRAVMERDAIPMYGRVVHPAGAGEPVFQAYSTHAGDAINSVSRGGLNMTLIDAAAREPGVEMHFEQTCTDIDVSPGHARAAFRDAGGASRSVDADLIASADGAFSAVRGVMMKTDRFEYQQTYLQHGYKELHIPPAMEIARGAEAVAAWQNSAAAARAAAHMGTRGRGIGVDASKYAMDPSGLHIWPRGGKAGAMMIALPNRDGSFTCTLFWPMSGDEQSGGHAFDRVGVSRDGGESVRAFFEREYGDAAAIMPTLEQDFASNPVSSLVTVRCFPWQRDGRVAMLGDAAHAIVPFYGQGMNAAFEDVVCMTRLLVEHSGDQRAALEAYQFERKPQADAIAQMALENFVEMRDLVGREDWRYRKRIEQVLHAAEPERCVPRYNLVSFSTQPYTAALKAGERLEKVIASVAAAVPMTVLSQRGEEAWRQEVTAAGRRVLDGRGAAAVLHDCSPVVNASLPVWPGDTPASRRVLCELSRGDTVTLSTLTATVHLGSHADGPNHYAVDGRPIDRQPLDHYIGECIVVSASTPRGGRVRPEDLRVPIAELASRRVLIRTNTHRAGGVFDEGFAGLSVELVERLAAAGVITVGVDTPSVDTFDSKDLPAHKAIHRANIAILEGLVLEGVGDGRYELIAPPLKLEGFDASPVRAVLRAL